MKFLITFFILSCMLVSCNNGNLTESLRSKSMLTASRFASEKIDSAILVTDNNGVVSVGDDMVRYLIDPNNIFYGEIDEIPGKEILVTIDSLHDPYLMPLWHLILSEEKEQIKIKTTIRSDYRILSINKGIITAEIPTHDPSSPLYYCSECRDTVECRINKGKFELVTSDN